MNYLALTNKIRKEVTKVTEKTMDEMYSIYKEVADSIASDLKHGSLTERWASDYKKELEAYRAYLVDKIVRGTTKGIYQAADMGSLSMQTVTGDIFATIGFEMKPNFTEMLSSVQNQVVEDIIGGGLYKDKKSLSARIWQFTAKNRDDLQYVIARGMVEKKSAIELARDVQTYIKPPSKRLTDWGKVYPNLKSKQIDYSAMRLARTTINHSYQTSTIKSSMINPFVTGIRWRSALIHGRTCQLCMDRHDTVYKIDEVPLDHPNGLCTMIPETEDLDKVAEELKRWVEGEDNPTLDKWYSMYGNYFAYKGPYDTYNSLNKIENIVIPKIDLSNKGYNITDDNKVFKKVTIHQKAEMQRDSNQVLMNSKPVERKSIYGYTSKTFQDINTHLTGNYVYDEKLVKRQIKHIDNVIDRFELNIDTLLYRGANKEHYSQYKVGDVFEEKMYWSTSIDHSNARTFSLRKGTPLIIEIETPAGKRGMYLGDNSRFKNETEFLLKRGTKFQVLELTDSINGEPAQMKVRILDD